MIERQKDAKKRVVAVLVTFPGEEVARQIGSLLVELQLAACVNILPGATSIYRWEGKVHQEEEVLGILKTTEPLVPKLQQWIQEHHPYDEPEFLVLPVEAGAIGYTNWVRSSVEPSETSVDKPTS